MRTLCLLAALLLFCAPAVADDAKQAPAPELGQDVCQWMVTYQPDENGGAEYKPGVDADGKPVVPADLNPSPVTVPDTISFPLTIDLAQYAGVPVPAGTEEKAVIGTVIVDKQGRMTFNGQPMEGQAEAALRALCAPEQAPEDAKSNHNQ